MLPNVSSLATLSKSEFVEAISVLFEAAPPLADRLYQQSFSSYQELIDQAETQVSLMTEADKLLVINAHPRIGAPAKTLSSLSYREQGYASVAASDEETTNHELMKLNQEYESKFGFRFVVFVNKRPRKDIIPVIKERMNNTREQELQRGLSEMMSIARDRLKKL